MGVLHLKQFAGRVKGEGDSNLSAIIRISGLHFVCECQCWCPAGCCLVRVLWAQLGGVLTEGISVAEPAVVMALVTVLVVVFTVAVIVMTVVLVVAMWEASLQDLGSGIELLVMLWGKRGTGNLPVPCWEERTSWTISVLGTNPLTLLVVWSSNTPSWESHQLDSDSDEEHDDDYLNDPTVPVNTESQLFGHSPAPAGTTLLFHTLFLSHHHCGLLSLFQIPSSLSHPSHFSVACCITWLSLFLNCRYTILLWTLACNYMVNTAMNNDACSETKNCTWRS